MENQETFKSASEALEHSLEGIEDAKFFVGSHQPRVAYGLLLGGWDEVEQQRPALDNAREEIAAIADRIRHHGQFGPKFYESAHRAVVEIYDDLFLLLQLQIRSDSNEAQQEQCTKELFEKRPELLESIDTSLLRAEIRRERAKLLHATVDTNSLRAKRKRNGRPKRTETPLSHLIIGAIQTLLHRSSNPPTQQQIADVATSPTGRPVNKMAVSDFIRKHFGDMNRFKDVWKKGGVEAKLLELQGPQSKERFGLRPAEYGRRSDDE